MTSFFVGCTNDQLRDVGLFANLDEAALDDLRANSHFIGAYPGLHIIRKDGAGFELYIILSGEAEVRRGDEVVASLEKGDIFGEMAMISDHHRNADVVATSVMSIMTMSADDFRHMAREHPEIEQRLRKLAESREKA